MAQDTNSPAPHHPLSPHQIEELIDGYFLGKTTSEEESLLRDYFASDRISAEHRELIPLFTEVRPLLIGYERAPLPPELSLPTTEKQGNVRIRLLRPYLMGGIAAALLLAIPLGYHLFFSDRSKVKYSSTLFIAGERIQDEDEAAQRAEEALQAVALPLSTPLPQLSIELD
ncbi:hypothetical protein [uncultured Porphyromonas sp.]|uniref:hypothetical protein n=1 Tax=uncultured Porphyromonas sp. TaxID=159274 RepID=UPI002606FA6E|nr:hypothetical protein [uncultured Porphyromonas sp.]